MMELDKRYKEVCNDYLKRFCEKHEMNLEPNPWVGDCVGEVAMIGDYFFNFDDIRYDLDNDCEDEAILEWYDYDLRLAELGCERRINFKSWVKGCPKPYTKEELDHIDRLHWEVESARRTLENAIKNAKGEY